MKFNYFRYIVLPKLRYKLLFGWLSARIEDYIHRNCYNPWWDKTVCCGKQYCRNCGGKYYHEEHSKCEWKPDPETTEE